MNEQERIDAPLTPVEKLAAFLAVTRAIDEGGCRVGFGRIMEDDEHGIDLGFALPKFMVRDICDTHPAEVEEARNYFAQGIEAQRAETVKQGSVHESPVGEAETPKGEGQ